MGRAKQLTFDELEAKQSFREVKGPYELPEGWRWVRLKEVVTEDRKQIDPQEYPDKEFWLVTMDCVESNTGKLLQRVIVKGKDIKSVKFNFNADHVLYGKLRPYLNKVYAPDGNGICTTEFIPLLPKPRIHRVYLSTYLRTQYVVDYAMKNLTGSRQPRVDLDAFFKLPVPLPFKNNKPDLEEQKRIVAKIEELFSKIDKIVELRRQAKEEAENLFKAALHHVFSRADEKGWRWVKLGDIANHFMGGTPRKNVSEYWEGGKIYWATATDVDENEKYVYKTASKITEKGLRNSNAKLCPPGTVLLVTTASIGKVAIAGVELAINQQITGIIPKQKQIVPEFMDVSTLPKPINLKHNIKLCNQ